MKKKSGYIFLLERPHTAAAIQEQRSKYAELSRTAFTIGGDDMDTDEKMASIKSTTIDALRCMKRIRPQSVRNTNKSVTYSGYEL